MGRQMRALTAVVVTLLVLLPAGGVAMAMPAVDVDCDSAASPGVDCQELAPVRELPTASPTGLVILTVFIMISGISMLSIVRKRHSEQ